jgi:hypothetical protein
MGLPLFLESEGEGVLGDLEGVYVLGHLFYDQTSKIYNPYFNTRRLLLLGSLEQRVEGKGGLTTEGEGPENKEDKDKKKEKCNGLLLPSNSRQLRLRLGR